jgi:hypothetical protein
MLRITSAGNVHVSKLIKFPDCDRILQESGGQNRKPKSELKELNYPRLRVVGFFPLGVAVEDPAEAGIASFSFCFPFINFLVGAFQ